ncbi:MAG TPA: FAD-dependent oxidoreductase, partial [Myxococcota bacterium]|nr:FAD-dependent oxidoreductase [Myxococcota bacterium]
MSAHADVIVIGAGHNGLVAATLLARAGLDVCILERSEVAGGAVRTEHPFARAPDLGQSTGAYLLGLMPPELIAELGLELPLRRRDPHYFLPTTGARYLLLGADPAASERQLASFFSPRDVAAIAAMDAELAALREDLGPSWLCDPLSLEDTAARYVRPALREVFIDLCRGSVLDHLARFDFQDPLLVAMFAVTDG